MVALALSLPPACSIGAGPRESRGCGLMPTLEEWVVVLLLIVVLISTAVVGLMS
jgi:hypothetical protein